MVGEVDLLISAHAHLLGLAKRRDVEVVGGEKERDFYIMDYEYISTGMRR
jgi:hypothetical protein